MARFVLILGPPAAGKTTLITYLKDAGVDAIFYTKDHIKELLGETFEVDGIAASQKVGAAAWDVMLMILTSLSSSDQTVVVDANFKPHHRQWLTELESNTGAQVDQVLCTANPEVLLERFRRRAVDGSRDKVHFDHDRGATIEEVRDTHAAESVFADLAGERVLLDTSDDDTISYDAVMALFSAK